MVKTVDGGLFLRGISIRGRNVELKPVRFCIRSFCLVSYVNSDAGAYLCRLAYLSLAVPGDCLCGIDFNMVLCACDRVH